MIKLEIENAAEIARDFAQLAAGVAKSTDKSLSEAGRFVQSEAKKRAPIGPTKSQARTDPQYNYDAKKSPGTLRGDIDMRKGRDYVDVGIMQGASLQYANKIHNGRGTAWRRLGPASKKADGTPRVGEKFIDRAYDENADEVNGIFDKGVTAQVRRFNDGN
jgi:hypothetical protein